MSKHTNSVVPDHVNTVYVDLYHDPLSSMSGDLLFITPTPSA